VEPSLAVDLNMLEYVNELFVHSPPNTTAWCDTLEAFLGNRRYKLSSKVCHFSVIFKNIQPNMRSGCTPTTLWKCITLVCSINQCKEFAGKANNKCGKK